MSRIAYCEACSMQKHGAKTRIALEHTCGLETGAIGPDVHKGSFFDLPKDKTCRHPEHQPPSHIHIPQGKGYRHVCPGCGKAIDIIPQQITL